MRRRRNHYSIYSLHTNRYIALPLTAFICFQWFTGNLAPVLAVAYLLILGTWFILG
jgi:hypothetical protein